MGEKKVVIFDANDLSQFRNWLNFNMEGLTWQGRFEAEFEDFWKTFFEQDITFFQMMNRFDYATDTLKNGPLNSWFNWLREKFMAYTFIYKGMSIYELSNDGEYSVSKFASILRNFFLDIFPYLDDEISERFQVGNVASSNLDLTFHQLKEELDLKNEIKCRIEEEVMPSLEVTLYDEWNVFLKKIKSDFSVTKFTFSKKKNGSSYRKILVNSLEFLLFLCLGAAVIWATRDANRWYEKYLVNKIKTYGPNLEWLDKTLVFKKKKEVVAESAKNFDFEKLDIKTKLSVKDIFEQEGRIGTESDLTLTSWDALPKDFGHVNTEQSKYEENQAKGYRANRYGSTKVYRILMQSTDTITSAEKLKKLLAKFKVTQVDNVAPGTKVPGGIYYNLFVPRESLKEFVASVMDVDKSVLYESKTKSGKNPVGKNKIFIWVKSI